MHPHVQTLADRRATRTALLRRPGCIDTEQLSTGAFSLVREDRDERRPAGVLDLLGQHTAGQALDVEIFNGVGVVRLDDRLGRFVVE